MNWTKLQCIFYIEFNRQQTEEQLFSFRCNMCPFCCSIPAHSYRFFSIDFHLWSVLTDSIVLFYCVTTIQMCIMLSSGNPLDFFFHFTSLHTRNTKTRNIRIGIHVYTSRSAGYSSLNKNSTLRMWRILEHAHTYNGRYSKHHSCIVCNTTPYNKPCTFTIWRKHAPLFTTFAIHTHTHTHFYNYNVRALNVPMYHKVFTFL